MPTLPAELYEKVQALAPGSVIARKLASVFNPAGGGAAPEAGSAAPVPAPVSAPSPGGEPAAEESFRIKDMEPATTPAIDATACSLNGPAAASDEPTHASVSGEQSDANQIPEPLDAETRYALAMAYKDMGLLEEAKEEFLGSMKDAGFFVDSCLMMALCLKEQNQSDRAIQLLEKLVADARCGEGNAQIVRYELGLLYEKVAAHAQAIAMYQSIPSFHDVPQRLHALRTENRNGRPSAHDPSHHSRAMQDSTPL
jgi:tetratricopeptide (TPR) repeat protein